MCVCVCCVDMLGKHSIKVMSYKLTFSGGLSSVGVITSVRVPEASSEPPAAPKFVWDIFRLKCSNRLFLIILNKQYKLDGIDC